MAKISAHNATKLAEGAVQVEGVGIIRIHFVLRSDGSVLKATSQPSAPTPYLRKRSGYVLLGKAPQQSPAELKAWFDLFLVKQASRFVTAGRSAYVVTL